MSDKAVIESSLIHLDEGRLLLLGGSGHFRTCNPRMVGDKMINLRPPVRTVDSDRPVVQLDPSRLLLLGGATDVAANPRMIGTKWSPTANCKT